MLFTVQLVPPSTHRSSTARPGPDASPRPARAAPAPPKPSARAVRHDETEQRILDAALALVVEGGFDGLSMSRLAAAVGMTPGALYRYIDSKDALLTRIMEEALMEVRAYLERAEAALPDEATPLTRVFALAFAYRAFARERTHWFGLLAMSMAEPRVLLRRPMDTERIIADMVAVLSALSSALDAAADARHLRPGDPSERTINVFAQLQGIMQLHKQARHAEAILDLDRLAVSGVSTLLLGWGAPQGEVEVALKAAAQHAPASPMDGSKSNAAGAPAATGGAR